MPSRFVTLAVTAICLFIFLTLPVRHHVSDIKVPTSITNTVSKLIPSQLKYKKPPKVLPPSSPNNCTETWLDNLVSEAENLTATVHYTRRCVKAKKSGARPRQSMTVKDEPLLKGTVTIDLNVCRQIPEPPCLPLELDVHPAPSIEDASHMIFGVSTTIDRLFDSIPQFARWLGYNGGHLVALVSESDEDSRREAELELRDLGINATVVPVDERLAPAQRHLSITEALYQRRIAGKTQWHVVIDDDTFFPYMGLTIDHLATHYDPSKPWYIGALSEDENALRVFGVQAYGGGGIFISAKLAEQIHTAYDDCVQHNPRWGDLIIRNCIFQHTKTKLTVDNNFHQLDLEDDVSGFYEGGLQPHTVHHYKSWSHLPLERMHMVADYCQDCFLQRWQFNDDMILTNGFSAAYYPKGIHFDVERMEATHTTRRQKYDWSLSLRPKLPPEEKQSYRLLDSRFTEEGSVRQLYFKPGKLDEWGNKRTNDEVIEVMWGDDSY